MMWLEKTPKYIFVIGFLFLVTLMHSQDWTKLKSWESQGRLDLAHEYVLELKSPNMISEELAKAVHWYLLRVETYDQAWEWLDNWQGYSFPQETLLNIYSTLLEYSHLASDWDRFGSLAESLALKEQKLLWALQTGQGAEIEFSSNTEADHWAGVLDAWNKNDFSLMKSELKKAWENDYLSEPRYLYFMRMAHRGAREWDAASQVEYELVSKFRSSPEALLIAGRVFLWTVPNQERDVIEAPDRSSPDQYEIQLGVFNIASNADSLLSRLELLGWKPYVVNKNRKFFIMIKSENPILDTKTLKNQGFDSFIRQ